MAQTVSGAVKEVGYYAAPVAGFPSDWAYVKLNGAIGGTYNGGNPDAAGMFAIDLTTDFGKRLYAVLLSLHVAGLPIKISGNNTFIGSMEKVTGFMFPPTA